MNWDIRAEKPQDAVFIAELLDQSFGAGRFVKSAYRLREGRAPVAELSFVVLSEGALVGSVRFWPVLIGETEALLLGPIATSPAFRGKGAASALINFSCEKAQSLGHRLVILVGDLEYYERVGFKQLVGKVRMPAPVDYARLLVRPLVEGAEKDLGGDIVAPKPPSAKFCGYESVMVT